MANRSEAVNLKVGRPLRPEEEVRTFLAEFEEHVSSDLLPGWTSSLPLCSENTSRRWNAKTPARFYSKDPL
jgi:hypothetical protein